jgi:predicted kinase
MNRPTMIMMCGLVGSGKSYEAKKLAKKYDAHIHSSDDIRKELSGDINNQDINDLVFKTLHNRIKEDLLNGKNCIYDACNISYKRRMSFLQELKNIPCEKLCVLMATPYEECLKNNLHRDRVVPEYVIERMYRNFDIPWYYEGWDDIVGIYNSYNEDGAVYYGSPLNMYHRYKHFNQNNLHHNLTLGEHCGEVSAALDNTTPTLKTAGLLHDCGKPFCKTFVNGKGEVTEQAHYYNHEKVGSYNSLFYDVGGFLNPFINPLYIAVIIRWHMQPYFWEKDNNEKQHSKYRKLWGEELYSDIMKLHEADKNAH